MKTKQIHIYLLLALFIGAINVAHASSDKNERTE